MIGPLLLHEGSEEQKHEHLPKIARGEIRWCQGYSEPGAGSDLASLQTRAVPAGDDFVVQRSEDLDVVRRSRGLDVRAGAHRSERAEQAGITSS